MRRQPLRLSIDDQVYDEVWDGLFVGPEPHVPEHAADAFQAILDCRNHRLSPCERIYRDHAVAYRWFPFADGDVPPPDDQLNEVLAWLTQQHQAGKRCLVHCAAGISRSVFIACLYLLPHFANNSDRTLIHVRCRRPIANPAATFRECLRRRAKQSVPASETGFAQLLREEETKSG